MSAVDVAMIVAVLAGPLMAVQISAWLERRRERKARRVSVYRSLMATRANRMSLVHVEALNMIDIEFHGSNAVLSAWKEYLDHLNALPNSMEVWVSRREDLFVDLLHTMSVSLGYEYDKTHIRRTSYFPQGLGDLERDQLAIRTGITELLEGKRMLPVWAVSAPAEVPPPLPELKDEQQIAAQTKTVAGVTPRLE